MNQLDKIIELFLRHLDGQTVPAEARRVNKLIKNDPEMMEIFKIMESLKSESLPPNLEELTPALKNISMKMFRAHKARSGKRKLPDGLLVYDSRLLPLAAGVRPASTNTRRLKYKFDKFEIELTCYPVSLHSFEIIGRVIGNAGDRLSIALVRGRDKLSCEVDELGMFIFEQTPRDKYRLEILMGDTAIGECIIEL